MSAKTKPGPVSYGDCAIRDTVGNAKIIISLDFVKGASPDEIARRYRKVQETVGAFERQRAIREVRNGA